MAKSRKRQRDYKAEYARRDAKGRAAGKTRQQARGHKVREHVARAERTRVKYGVSPSQLTRLRKTALDHIYSGLLTSHTKHTPNRETVAHGIYLLNGEALELAAEMDVTDWRMMAIMSPADLPDPFDDIDEEWNPAWYA